MATLTQLRDLALAFPEVTEATGGSPSWIVAERPFVWERPLRKSDLKALGDSAPTGDTYAARTLGLLAKDEWLERFSACFTTPHFEGYPVVLFVLEEIGVEDLKTLLGAAWQATVSKAKRKRTQNQLKF